MTGFGIIKYGDNFRISLEVQQALVDYYLSLIPKYLRVNRGRDSAHITVVRPYLETPKRVVEWGKYEGRRIYFIYDGQIHNDNQYYWLNIQSRELEEIRLGLGLLHQRWNLTTNDWDSFHLTLGNTKMNTP